MLSYPDRWMDRMRALARLTALLLLAVLVVLALAPAAPVAARALSAPDAEASVQPIRQAYDLLLDRFIQPLAPDQLLAAGWRGAMEELKRQGLATLQRPTPPFSGDRAADWELFEAQYRELARAAEQTVPPSRLGQAVIRALAAFVDEGHTNFLDPEQYREYLAWTRGDVRYSGIGARLHGSQPTIVEVFDGSPAQQAGLRPGDRIVAVNGVPLADQRSDEVVRQIRGPEGTSVRVTVQRAGSSEPLTFEIVRATIQLPIVTSRMVADDVGYIALRSFPEPSVVAQVDQAHGALREQGARALVLDLRGNSGGRLDVGVELLSRLVADGALYEEYDRSGQRRTSAPNGRLWEPQLPLVVLVDGGTASMGEIFAAAVQEHQVAWLIGTRTAGNVAAAQVFPLADGSALQVTVLEIRSGSGRTLNRVGVEPDETVELTPEDAAAGADPPLEAALGHLRATLDAASVPSGREVLPIAA